MSGRQAPPFGSPVIGGENVRLGLDAALREGLPDKFADCGSIGAHKSQDGRSRAAQAGPEQIRMLQSQDFGETRYEAGAMRLMPAIVKEARVEIHLAGEKLRGQDGGALQVINRIRARVLARQDRSSLFRRQRVVRYDQDKLKVFGDRARIGEHPLPFVDRHREPTVPSRCNVVGMPFAQACEGHQLFIKEGSAHEPVAGHKGAHDCRGARTETHTHWNLL